MYRVFWSYSANSLPLASFMLTQEVPRSLASLYFEPSASSITCSFGPEVSLNFMNLSLSRTICAVAQGSYNVYYTIQP